MLVFKNEEGMEVPHSPFLSVVGNRHGFHNTNEKVQQRLERLSSECLEPFLEHFARARLG